MDDLETMATRKLRAPFKCEPYVEQTYLDAIDKACFIQAKHTGQSQEALNVQVLRVLGWSAKMGGEK